MAELSNKKLEEIIFDYKKYHFGCTDDDTTKVEKLVREIFKYSSNEKVAMKIVNGLRRGHIFNIDDLLIADMDNISKIRGLGLISLNVIRQIKGLPIKTYAEEHPFSKRHFESTDKLDASSFNGSDDKKIFIDAYNYLSLHGYEKLTLVFESGATITVEITDPK